MGLAAIGQKTIRTALAAPIQGDDRKAAPAQIVDHLEIFLDEFRLAVQQHAEALGASASNRAARSLRPPASIKKGRKISAAWVMQGLLWRKDSLLSRLPHSSSWRHGDQTRRRWAGSVSLLHIAVLVYRGAGLGDARPCVASGLSGLPARDGAALAAQSRRLYPQQSGKLAALPPLAGARNQSRGGRLAAHPIWPTPPASRSAGARWTW